MPQRTAIRTIHRPSCKDLSLHGDSARVDLAHITAVISSATEEANRAMAPTNEYSKAWYSFGFGTAAQPEAEQLRQMFSGAQC